MVPPLLWTAYAVNLLPVAATNMGMQCLLSATLQHSRQSDWRANLIKTKVVIFGPARIPRGNSVLLWGGKRL